MQTTESLTSFYQQQGHADADSLRQREVIKSGQFNVYDIEQFCNQPMAYSRRDFYKIMLQTAGTTELHYADRQVVIDRPALVFSNPLVPYACDIPSNEPRGYFCLFTEDFLIINDRSTSLQDSPLFKIGSNPVFFLDEAQLATIRHLFQQLLVERESAYPYKQDLLRTYLHLIIHEALKMQPQLAAQPHASAAARIASLFTELLDRQFPIEAPDRALKLRTASDYAACLSLHVNNLNRAVREQTGKTTTAHIAERIISEAKALLQHTSWSVAKIGYALGFEYPTYFNNFFKKQTGLTPKALRG